MMHEKIGPHHLERKALLYVRQSSAHQVLHNRESSALQYAMRDRLTVLGWSSIETIDDDLGRSAAGGVTRAGFDLGNRGSQTGLRAIDLIASLTLPEDRSISRSCASTSALTAASLPGPSAIDFRILRRELRLPSA